VSIYCSFSSFTPSPRPLIGARRSSFSSAKRRAAFTSLADSDPGHLEARASRVRQREREREKRTSSHCPALRLRRRGYSALRLSGGAHIWNRDMHYVLGTYRYTSRTRTQMKMLLQVTVCTPQAMVVLYHCDLVLLCSSLSTYFLPKVRTGTTYYLPKHVPSTYF
jgi:hypothetical protein